MFMGNQCLGRSPKKLIRLSKFHEFLDNMFETMEKSDGLGLAAPQVGESIRLFVIDGKPLEEEDPTMKVSGKHLLMQR